MLGIEGGGLLWGCLFYQIFHILDPAPWLIFNLEIFVDNYSLLYRPPHLNSAAVRYQREGKEERKREKKRWRKR